MKILAAKDMSYPVLQVDGLVTSAKYLSKNSVCERKGLNGQKKKIKKWVIVICFDCPAERPHCFPQAPKGFVRLSFERS